jgi:hypothetical protein
MEGCGNLKTADTRKNAYLIQGIIKLTATLFSFYDAL